MLNNKIYLLDKWLSSNNREFIVFAMVCLSVILIAFETTLFYGISLLFIICLWVIFIKAKIMGGQIELDKNVYTLPRIGENIIIKKDFRYNINKVLNRRNYIHSVNYINFRKGSIFNIIDIDETKDDWIIMLDCKVTSLRHEVFYLDFKSNMKTTSDIRDEKLKKILK